MRTPLRNKEILLKDDWISREKPMHSSLAADTMIVKGIWDCPPSDIALEPDGGETGNDSREEWLKNISVGRWLSDDSRMDSVSTNETNILPTIRKPRYDVDIFPYITYSGQHQRP